MNNKTKPTVQQACKLLLSVCDGAVTRDGQGFNGLDSGFVRNIMERGWISFKQEKVLYKILRKYRVQLKSMGLDYGGIPEPVESKNKELLVNLKKKSLAKELRSSTHIKLDMVTDPKMKFPIFGLFSPFSFKDQARAIPTAHWNSDLRIWTYMPRPEVLEALRPYLSNLTIEPTPSAMKVIREIEGELSQRSMASEIKKGETVLSIPVPLKCKPYDYQVKAFQIGITLDQSALLMEQGTGKTLVAIAVSGYRFSQKQIKRLLVIAPLSVVPVWMSEFNKHALFQGTIGNLTKKDPSEIKSVFNDLKKSGGLEVSIINYESTWRIEELLKSWKPGMVIVDESQKIKNGMAKQSKAIHRIGDLVKYKMILTGTPITQGPLDTWSQYRFLNHRIFGRKFTSFRNRYAIMGGYGGYEIIGYRNLDELASKTHSIAFRITKDEALDLPPVVNQVLSIELNPSTIRIYKGMEEDFMVKWGDTEVATAPIILTQLLRLQQITGGFIPTDDGEMKVLDSSKLDTLKEFISDFPRGKKLVIFARFIPEVKAIERLVNDMNFKSVVLLGETKDRGEVVRKFQEDPTIKAFIAQIQTGGLGITLTAADTVVFYSTTFSFADYDQAKARVHRIGQRGQSVTYIHLISKGTVDSDILDALQSKGNTAEKIMDRMRERFTKNISGTPFTNPKSCDSMILGQNNLGSEGQMKKESINKTGKVPAGMMEGKIENFTGIWGKENPKYNKEGTTVKKEKATKEAKDQKAPETEETKMTGKLTKIKAESEKAAKAKETIEEEPKVTKTKKAATEEPGKKSDKKEVKVADPNLVTIKDLAKELGQDPKAVRKLLRKKFTKNEGESWAWKLGSKELTQVRIYLELDKAPEKTNKKSKKD